MCQATYHKINNIKQQISKHKDLELKVQKIWHLKMTVMPVVIVGELGLIMKNAENHII